MYTFDFGCRRSRRRRRKSDPDVLSIIARLRAAARALSRAAAIRGYNTPSGGLLFTILSAPRQPLKGGTASLAAVRLTATYDPHHRIAKDQPPRSTKLPTWPRSQVVGRGLQLLCHNCTDIRGSGQSLPSLLGGSVTMHYTQRPRYRAPAKPGAPRVVVEQVTPTRIMISTETSSVGNQCGRVVPAVVQGQESAGANPAVTKAPSALSRPAPPSAGPRNPADRYATSLWPFRHSSIP
jgi:hypothetical protein